MADKSLTKKKTSTEERLASIEKLLQRPDQRCPLHAVMTSQLTGHESTLQQMERTIHDFAKGSEMLVNKLEEFSRTIGPQMEEMSQKLQENIKATTHHHEQIKELGLKLDEAQYVTFKDQEGKDTRKKLSDVVEQLLLQHNLGYMVGRAGKFARNVRELISLIVVIIMIGFMIMQGVRQDKRDDIYIQTTEKLIETLQKLK